jgi:hypothetical protein
MSSVIVLCFFLALVSAERRRLEYQEPVWWNAITNEYTGSLELHRCIRIDPINGRPTEGVKCGKEKVCFFGLQTCAVGDRPNLQCTCSSSKVWSCQTYSCPSPPETEVQVDAPPKGLYTEFPSAAPTSLPVVEVDIQVDAPPKGLYTEFPSAAPTSLPVVEVDIQVDAPPKGF